MDAYLSLLKSYIASYVDQWVIIRTNDGNVRHTRFTIQDEIWMNDEYTGEKIPMLAVTSIMMSPPPPEPPV